MALATPTLTLYIILGIVAAIVYSLRVLVLLERRIAKMDENISKLTKKVLSEELKITKVEKKIAKKVGANKTKKRK